MDNKRIRFHCICRFAINDDVPLFHFNVHPLVEKVFLKNSNKPKTLMKSQLAYAECYAVAHLALDAGAGCNHVNESI